jgi:hypothetical protein
MRNLLLLLLPGLLLSCSEATRQSQTYYPIDSLIHAQARWLVDAGASLAKQGELDDLRQDTTFMPTDTLAWLYELDAFALLETMNKPLYRDRYEVLPGQTDVHSNLTIQTFRAKEELPVNYLNVYYQDTPDRLRKIEAVYREQNVLMKGSRRLVLEFQEVHNKITLVSYSIEGTQKMFLGNTVEFLVIGTLTLP